MSPNRFIDTNILLYSISTSRTEVAKHRLAVDLLESNDLALSVQVLQEFYAQLLTEDMSHGLNINGVTIMNPFVTR